MNCKKRISRRLRHLSPLVTIPLLLAGCFWPAEEEPLAFTLPTRFSNVPLAVGSQTYTVDRGEVVHTLTLDGIVQAGTQNELYFMVKGPITEIHVTNGDSVQPGDLLMELDAEEASLDVAQAQLAYRQAELRVMQVESGSSYEAEVAQLNLEIAQLQLEKLRWNPNTPGEDIEVAQREVDLANAALTRVQETPVNESRLDVTLAQVQLDMAEIALTRAKRNLESLQLRAPITGTIRMGQDLRIGYPVEAYKTVARIVDPQSLVVESNLPAESQQLLYEGMPVTLEINSLRGVTFPGRITVLPQPYGNGTTSLTQIVPELTSGNLSLREGIGVVIKAEIGRRDDVLWLPNRVVQTVAGQAYVVLREGDTLKEQAIEKGLVGEERTEIVSGLSEGMQVMGP